MRRVTHNTLILLTNNVGGALLAFVISAVIGRGLGVEGFGQYSFIMAWIAPLVAVADFGMGWLLTREVAQDRAVALPLLQAATRVLLPIASLILILAWLVMPLLHVAPAVTAGLSLVALLIVLDPWYGLYTALFRAFQRMGPILLVNVGGLALQLILSLIALAEGLGLVGISAVVIVVNVVQLVVIWIFWRAHRPARDPALTAPAWRAIVRRAMPFAIAGVLSVLQLRLNVLLLEHLSGDVGVGLYAAASRFVEAAKLIPAAFFGALFPALASLAEQPTAKRQTFVRASGLVTGFAVLFGLGMTVFGDLLIRLTYERGAFGGAAPVLTILAWSLIPALLRIVLTLYHYSLGHEQFVNVVIGLVLASQVVIGWPLISQWGAVGAALTVAIVETGGMLGLWAGLRSGVRQSRLGLSKN